MNIEITREDNRSDAGGTSWRSRITIAGQLKR